MSLEHIKSSSDFKLLSQAKEVSNYIDTAQSELLRLQFKQSQLETVIKIIMLRNENKISFTQEEIERAQVDRNTIIIAGSAVEFMQF